MNQPNADADPMPEIRDVLREVAATHMPFGKFGPDHFPRDGVPIYDLPYEYLAWFRRHGFPRGRLGELLKFVYQVKQDGADEMFNPFRQARGGQTILRRKKGGQRLRFD